MVKIRKSPTGCELIFFQGRIMGIYDLRFRISERADSKFVARTFLSALPFIARAFKRSNRTSKSLLFCRPALPHQAQEMSERLFVGSVLLLGELARALLQLRRHLV